MNRTLTPRDAYAEARNAFDHGRVVAVHEHGLGAVHRQRLRVGDEPLDRELEVAPLLDRALGHHAGAAGLRADEDRDRVQRRVARDADRRLHLGEAARGRLGGVGGEQRRVLLQVGDVRLVGRGPPRAQLLQREHQLDRVEPRDHACEPRRCQAARETDEIGARDVDVDEPAGDLVVVQACRLRGDVEVEAVPGDEAVDHVEVLDAAAVHRNHPPILDLESRLRIVGAVHRDEPELRVGRDQQLAAQLSLLARDEPVRPARAHRSPAARAPHTPRPPPERTRQRAARRTPSRAAQPTLRAPPPSSGAGGARCRSRGSCRSATAASSAARARLSASWVRPAASATADWRRSVSGVARRSSGPIFPARTASSVSSSSPSPDGVRTRSGRREPSG